LDSCAGNPEYQEGHASQRDSAKCLAWFDRLDGRACVLRLTGRDGFTHGQGKHGAKEYSYYDYHHDAPHHANNAKSS